MRRFGDARQPGQNYVRRPGVYAVISRGDTLLLTEQQSFDLELQLPGGGVDLGESAQRALHREVFEETGWRVQVVRRLGAYRRFTFMPEYDMWAEKICTIYHCDAVRKVGPPSEPGHKVVWMSPDRALQQLTNSGDRYFLARALGLQDVPRALPCQQHMRQWSYLS